MVVPESEKLPIFLPPAWAEGVTAGFHGTCPEAWRPAGLTSESESDELELEELEESLELSEAIPVDS